MPDHARPRDFRAPAADGGKLVFPPVTATSAAIAANRESLAACDYDLHGRTISALAAQARRELLAEALAYTRGYRDVSIDDRGQKPNPLPSLVLAGHQPELFHPGVWLKHFLLDGVARANGAIGVNLLVDSDTIKSSSLRVPSGSPEHPAVEAVLFDRPTVAVPFEERTIIDRAVFESFGGRAVAKLAGLVPDPLLTSFWPDVVRRSRATSRIGECLAQARHALEGRWGANTLEIPQSRVCSLPAFHRFAAHLLAHLPRLWDIYNAALYGYRRANRVRSRAHPVPELAEDHGWLEAPFWIWRADDPTRRRLFVRSHSDQIVLADRAGWEFALLLSAETDLDRAVEQMQRLAHGGVRLRTRALITTMLARLLLGDLFIHGIGGAKYDQMTDELMSQFFGIKPPDYMVVSGTLRLPVDYPHGADQAMIEVRQKLRRLKYQPERFLGANLDGSQSASTDDRAADAEPWRSLAAKRRWIATPTTNDTARARHQGIQAANQALLPFVGDRQALLAAQLDGLSRQSRAEAILSSRDYSFCLHPESQLRPFLSRAAHT
jgi:hypothetical protein